MALVMLNSCSNKGQVIKLSKDFFYALSDSTNGKPSDYYPMYKSLPVVVKSDMVEIDEDNISVINDTFIVRCLNNYTDVRGTLNQDSILLYIAKDSIGNLSIVDSKGFIVIDENIERFGKAIGGLTNETFTDQILAKRIHIIKSILFNESNNVEMTLQDNVEFSNWKWKKFSDGTPYGDCTIVNNLNYPVSVTSCLILYYDKNGILMSIDSKRIDETLYPGRQYSFSFMGRNVRNPYKVEHELCFSNDMVYNIIRLQKYTGKEFAEYLKNQ